MDVNSRLPVPEGPDHGSGGDAQQVMRLSDKVAIVSGVGPRMGQAVALLFAQEGARVVVIARSPDLGSGLVERIHTAGGAAHFIPANATAAADAERAISETVDRFERLDILVNNAGGGSFPYYDGPDKTAVEFFDEVLANNLRGPFLMSKYAIPALRAAGGGSIINYAAGYKTRRDGNVAYGTAKEGVIGLTRNMARALYADNIRVNAICPGGIRLPLEVGPIVARREHIQRAGRPEDAAFLALYLASDESPWVTGQTFVVDGGDEVLINRPSLS